MKASDLLNSNEKRRIDRRAVDERFRNKGVGKPNRTMKSIDEITPGDNVPGLGVITSIRHEESSYDRRTWRLEGSPMNSTTPPIRNYHPRCELVVVSL